MKLEVEVLGGYPRSDRLRKALRRLEEKGEESSITVFRILVEDTVLVAGIQVGAGMTRIVDPMLDWHDPLRPFAEAWRGVAIGGLQRWFDNNFFYRVPVFIDLPDPQRYVLAPRVRFLKSLGVGKVKAVLPGPYTFVKLGLDRGGFGFEKLVDAVTEALAREASLAVSVGADIVQVDEPMLGDIDAKSEEVKTVVERINEIVERAGGRVQLAIPYRPPSREVYRVLEGLKARAVILDVADLPDAALRLLEENVYGEAVGLGIIQARNIYTDDYGVVKNWVKKAMEALEKSDVKTIIATTSAWLDLIPFERALEKTRLLGVYAQRLSSELGLELLT